MPYDPKWEAKTVKPHPMSVAGLIEWLETQDPAMRYSYADIHGCLLARYFKAQGYRWAYCGSRWFSYSRFFLPPLFTKAIPEEMNRIALQGERSYGAALERARAA